MISDLAIIVPTLNERDNIVPLHERLAHTLGFTKWEIIFVDDDSNDGTKDVLMALARTDERVRFIIRVGRRGLSSACMEGMAATSAPYLAVMDADLQHDETLLPEMLKILKAGDYDLVVGSRYLDEGGLGDWDQNRQHISRVATLLGQKILKTHLSDPMSGFFMLSRDLFNRAQYSVSAKGFKILLDIVSSVKGPLRYKELPYFFKKRNAGESKLDVMAIWEFLLLILDKTIGRFVPVRFVMFVTVGGIGALLHLSVLWLFLYQAGTSFAVGQSAATFFAMTLNFVVNNVLTYRDKRLHGLSMIQGLLFFYIVCSIGAIANIQTARLIFEKGVQWWLSGLLGAVIGAVWNYSVSSAVIWRNHQRRMPPPAVAK